MVVSSFTQQRISADDFDAFKRGKQSGFDAAYRAYASHVYSLCVHLICDESTGKFIVRRLFEEMLFSRHKFSTPKHLGAWLEEAAKIACQSYVTALGSELQTSGDKNATPLNDLPSGQRAMVYSHALQNLKQQAQTKSLDDIISISPPIGKPNKGFFDWLRRWYGR
ncbi:hypothetical protein ACFSJY_15890 [Thalassotalea euphylliae]|uniref:hypothetical protein n=1 Tax=Thalassotalea euphylliae TaxID=1655234 RepID=UPI003625EAA1